MLTQILIFQSFFGTGTIPAHHIVGSSTFDITPIDVMLSSSSFTRSRRGKGIFLAVNRAWGLASALSLIVYASPRFPRPLKRSGYLRSTISFWLSMDPSSIVSTLATMLSAVIAGRPKN